MRRCALFALAILTAAVVITGCGKSPEPTSTVTTSAATPEPSRQAMNTIAQRYIRQHATDRGMSIIQYGPPLYPNDLVVVMWAEVINSGKNSRLWFRTSFAAAGTSLTVLESKAFLTAEEALA